MSKRRNAKNSNKPVSLLILEGYTENIYYPILRDNFLKNIRIELRNIKGQGNINKDILSEIYKYVYNNPKDLVRTYCCVDSEKQKRTATPLDLNLVREYIRNRKLNHVLSVDSILADPDIESWFFCDVEGIYKFLGAKKSRRNIKKYQDHSKFGKKELKKLFHMFGKEYIPGRRAEFFISQLDVVKIVSKCKELSDGIALCKSNANDSTNHLF